MRLSLVLGSLSAGLCPVLAATAWQSRAPYVAAVPQTPVSSFASSSLTTKDDALAALSKALDNGTVSFPGDLEYGTSIARIWTEQLKTTYPDAIVFPTSPEEVSLIMQFYSEVHPLWQDGFAILGGGHFDDGGAQSPSVIVDLRNVGTTEIVTHPSDPAKEYAVLKIGGGAEAGRVYSTLEGTGWAFLGPRAGSIGVGGFLLGGGIAFQTNRYGVANDNLLGLEVVLINGTIIYANPYNEYSDLFWAATGGGWLASFGVITHFFMQAYPDPGSVYVGTLTWGEEHTDEVCSKTAALYEGNTDPDVMAGLLYYFKDPTDLGALVPIIDRKFTFQLNALYFGGSWEKFNATFGQFYENAEDMVFQEYNLETLDQYLLTNYPYGYNRLFFGKSHTNSTADFYRNTFSIYKETVNGMLARGEDPGHTLWVDEYVFPGWNGAGPASDSDTAWPHSTSAHITLTSGEWSNDSTTQYLYDRDRDSMMSYLRSFQDGLGEKAIYDYPNYIAPYSVTEEVWGAENFKRLMEIKAKYDPRCLLSRGRVPATEACVAKGLANTYLQSS